MRVYFVRHGESGSNAAKVRQGHSDELSEVGKRQAEIVAKRFTSIPFDMIIASHYTRAQQTAEAISIITGKPVITNELIHEIRHPKETIGLSWTDSEWIRIVDLCKAHIAEPDWHYSDEENFFDLRARAMQFVDYLQTLEQDKSVVVVTHGLFLIVLVMVMKMRENFSPELYELFRNFLYLNNTGITVLDNSYNGEWWLMTWNDYAHLGEL